MKIYVKVFLFFIIILFASCAEDRKPESSSGFILTDAMNEQFRFDSVPSRVISLAPNITEIIYYLNQQDRLIANTKYCNYPEDAKNKVKVADILTVNFEQVVSLKPDLILMPIEGETIANYHRLKELGLKVFVTKYAAFGEIDSSFLQIGQIFGVKDKADSIVKNWNSRLAAVRDAISKEEQKKGIFLLSNMPIIVAGKNSFIHKILESAGMQNSAGDINIGYPEFSREEMLKRNPEYIIIPHNDFGTLEEIRNTYPEWPGLKAFKEKKALEVNPDLFMRAGPRYVEAVETLHSVLSKAGTN
ncbi:MAG TPA: helical backbone metal receptor [Ignavibacteriales bacterium]|nr:helical backbone metal receptor [Ignavibacteriales bacterium]